MNEGKKNYNGQLTFKQDLFININITFSGRLFSHFYVKPPLFLSQEKKEKYWVKSIFTNYISKNKVNR